MKDILSVPKFKGVKHHDKPVSQFNKRGSEKIGGPCGGFQGVTEPVEPFGNTGFAKSMHKHGSVPNKINYKG